MAEIQVRVFNGSQICHHPRLFGKRQTHLAEAPATQLQMFYRMGFIEAETDEAWKKKRREDR